MLRVLAILATMAGTVQAQGEHLGTIAFPTSGSPAAHEKFIRGVLYLHSFEYESAAEEFRAAQRLEPGFAMAYWGEAMTYTHPVWNQQDKPAALAALARLASTPEARARRAATPRERAWLHAVEVLYGRGTKAERDTLYSGEMERMAEAAPADDEAQSFFALSLMGLSQGTRVVPTYMRAGAIALAVMQRNPDHPGATHYVIHAFDDPIHATQGLGAARAYSGIAPGAAHAQHMTTHIFLALGMWEDVVKQNVIALGRDSTQWKPGHYSSWLLYGLLQQGRFLDARNFLALMDFNTSANMPLSQRATLVLMRDYYTINVGGWIFGGREQDLTGVGPMLRAVQAFTGGYAAWKHGTPEVLSAYADTARRIRDMPDAPAGVGVIALQLAGLVRLRANDTTGAIELLRRAAVIEDTLPMEFGPPLIIKPSHELLGEVYLQHGSAKHAQGEFERALELAPRRLRSVIGLAESAILASDTTTADRAVDNLGRALFRADRDDPELRLPDWVLAWLRASGIRAARGAIDAARARGEDNPDLYDLLSNVCVFENNYKCAVDALESLYAIDSTKADSSFFIKITLFAAQPTEAPDTTRLLKWAQVGVNRYPTNITLLNQLLGAYVMKGQMDSAFPLALRLIEIDTTTAAPAILMISELVKQDSIMKALPLVDLVLKRGSAEDRENAAILLVNGAFTILRQPADSGIRDTVRLGHAAEVSRRAIELADSTRRSWPNANYALALSLVFQISRIDPEAEKQRSCPLTRREGELVAEAAPAIPRARPANAAQVDQYGNFIETVRARIASNIRSYCV